MSAKHTAHKRRFLAATEQQRLLREERAEPKKLIAGKVNTEWLLWYTERNNCSMAQAHDAVRALLNK